MNLLLIATGGALGAVLRYLTISAIGQRSLFGLPMNYGTLAVNIVGSLLMGILIGAVAKYFSGAQNIHLFLAVGMLGSFTTFSTFSLDVVNMLERGEFSCALIYIILSITLSITGLFAGLMLMRLF